MSVISLMALFSNDQSVISAVLSTKDLLSLKITVVVRISKIVAIDGADIIVL